MSSRSPRAHSKGSFSRSQRVAHMAVGHPLLGSFFPDMRDLGFSEEHPGFRAAFGFKAMLPLYPLIGVYSFVQLLKSGAK